MSRFVLLTAAVCFLGVPSGLCLAQTQPFVTGGQAAVGPGAVGGVYIDSRGLLRETSSLTSDQRLKLLRAESIKPPSDPELTAGSQLRKVSLRRLEQAVRTLDENNQPRPPEIRYLAGLTRLEYVFFDPRRGAVILAGPAEGWDLLPTGDVVGTQSRRPVLQLDDLIVALRYAFGPSPNLESETSNSPVAADPFIGCSIEPTKEGLQDYNRYMRRLGGRIDRSRLTQVFAGMERAMGPQAVKLYGVPGSSRFALKLLAADYRLKRIALAHDRSPVPEVSNYLDLAARRFRGAGAQRQHRWWFVGHYEAVRHTPDELAFQFEGQGVKVATAPTFRRNGSGSEEDSAAGAAAQRFADAFSEHYPEMAAKVPVFAELQNLVALSLAAELIAQKNPGVGEVGREFSGGALPRTPAEGRPLNGNPRQPGSNVQTNWRPAHFLDATRCPIAEHPVPAYVPSLANYRLVRGRHWLISISGGVEIDPGKLADIERRESLDGKLAALREQQIIVQDSGRWWWD